ncbi:putative membrane protein [Alloactinosynnema sp. L-07]|uniref:DsbA family protein n=1 Tax=Alloactinosynnema sp. L-07 TaxID=1653480 RepID=UPI00065EFAE8|nr:thioredoxin domain-containing protein [Alloactinosynnema sp. L-07]CRK61945.1 putative membrane protein [Alloactinosynnema sp. L-07]
MGGAERSARKRKQTTPAKSAVAAARAVGPDRSKIILGVVAVVLIAAAVIGGVIYTNSQKNATQGQAIKVVTVSVDAPVKRDGGVVEVGKDTAKVTLDVYEDFLCPACAVFEGQVASALEGKIADGTLKVRFHLVNLLNNKSDPAGYSTDSANAALLAADEGKFLSFHKSLFEDQPAEGARGWTKDQLIELGKATGVTSSAFVDGVRSGKYDSLVSEEYQKARSDEGLQQDFGGGQKGFGTPTLATGGKAIDTSDPNWLDKLTG